MTPLSVVTRKRDAEIDAPLFVGGTDAHEHIARIMSGKGRATRAANGAGFERRATRSADELVDLHEETLGSGLGTREAR